MQANLRLIQCVDSNTTWEGEEEEEKYILVSPIARRALLPRANCLPQLIRFIYTDPSIHVFSIFILIYVFFIIFFFFSHNVWQKC